MRANNFAKTLTQDDTDYLNYVFNEHILYPIDMDEKCFYFVKKKIDPIENITYILNRNERFFRHASNSNETEKRLLYSYQDFISAVKVCDHTKIQTKIKEHLEKIKEDFNSTDEGKKILILTPEGAGKSQATLDLIESGDIYSAPDREILKEKETYLESIKKEYLRFHSHADIIYTTILNTRKSETDAERIANQFLEECSTLDRTIDKNELSDMINKLQEKNMEFIIGELQSEDIEIDEDCKDLKEFSAISLLRFLKENQEMEDYEKEMILQYYEYLIAVLIEGTKIITCTTHKLRILLQKINFKRKILVYCDEIINDVHGNAQVVNTSTMKKQYFNFVTSICRINETDTEIDDNLKEKIERLKRIRKVYNWYTIRSYKNFTSVVEIKESKWMEQNNLTFVILTTEEKSKIIFPNAKIIDLRHRIYAPHLHLLCIDGLNKTKSDEKLFKGHERLLVAKETAKYFLNIKDEYYIGDGIGHSLENGLMNNHNVRGSNKLFNKIKGHGKKSNVGIAITHPHPEQINLHKGLMCSSFNEIKYDSETNKDKLLEQYESLILNIIVNDQIHQSVGRNNGYRNIDNIDTYVLISSKLLHYINLYYVTPNVHHLYNYENLKYFRDKNQNVYMFLKILTYLLNKKSDKKDDRDENVDGLDFDKYRSTFMRELGNMFPNTKDLILYYWERYTAAINKISENFIKNLKNILLRIKGKLQKIKYSFCKVIDLAVRFLPSRDTHMKLDSLIKFIEKSREVSLAKHAAKPLNAFINTYYKQSRKFKYSSRVNVLKNLLDRTDSYELVV